MKALKYSDISLLPSHSDCETRSDCNTEVTIGGRSFRLPIIPANMKSVVSADQCRWLSANNYFYIMHRFDLDVQGFIENANRENWPIVSASLGVKAPDQQIVSNLRASGARLDFLTLDIAHGHLGLMKKMIECCKKNLPETTIIAGNVATPEGVEDLGNWGADIVKVGIGQGSPCTTKDKTGFTVPMFTCAQQCSKSYTGGLLEGQASQRIPVIADGGVRCNGDIAKALVAGADLVMGGGLFACCSDSPAASIEIDGILHNAYYGSASFENKKTRTHIEGKLNHIPSCGMNLETKLKEITEDLQSSLSYAGGNTLEVFKKVKYTQV